VRLLEPMLVLAVLLLVFGCLSIVGIGAVILELF